MKKLALIVGLFFVAGTCYAMLYPGEGGVISNEPVIESFHPIKNEVVNIIPVGNLSANSAISLLQSLANDIAKELGKAGEAVDKNKDKEAEGMITLLNNAAAVIGEAKNPAVKVGFSLLKDGKLGIHLQAYDVEKNPLNSRKPELKKIADLGIAVQLEPKLAKKIAGLLKEAINKQKEAAIGKILGNILNETGEIVPPSEIAEDIVDALTLNIDQLSVTKVVDLLRVRLKELNTGVIKNS